MSNIMVLYPLMYVGGGRHFFQRTPTLLPILIVIGVFVLIFAFSLIIRSSKKNKKEFVKKATEADIDLEGQILSMLTQHGGELTQIQILENMHVSAESLAEILHKLEESGEIERNWLNGEYTYQVKKTK